MASDNKTMLLFHPSTTNVNARIHPVVLFNICDSYVRRPDQAERVIGTLLGSVSADGIVDIKNSYAVPHNESADQVALDIDYHHTMREIINHRLLRHSNIIRFKEVVLTPTDLAIVMEYAGGGELFEQICNAGRFSEDEASYFFQQLISGVSYCHFMQICHHDLKLENTLLDESPAPRLKICDFGYSKSS